MAQNGNYMSKLQHQKSASVKTDVNKGDMLYSIYFHLYSETTCSYSSLDFTSGLKIPSPNYFSGESGFQSFQGTTHVRIRFYCFVL